MPRISGFEMLDILRNTENLKDTKVIMLTALGQSDDKTRANSPGADRYLVKSQVTLEDIVKAAHELLESANLIIGVPPVPIMAPPTPITTPLTVAPMPAPLDTPPIMQSPAYTQSPPPVIVQPTPVTIPIPQPVMPPSATTIPQPLQGASSVPITSTPPTPQTVPTLASIPALPTTMQPLSTDEEKAAVGTQIDSFVQTMPIATPEVPLTNASQDDVVLAYAMKDLSQNAEEQPADTSSVPITPDPMPTPLTVGQTTQPAGAIAPQAPPSLIVNDSVSIANKKIIQPISAPEQKPGIHELLAREEAANLIAPSTQALTPPPLAPTTFSPTNGISSPQAFPQAPSGQVITPTMSTPPSPPVAHNDFDPNNIAL
jgi:CheY-like chemotaxis protein